MQISTFEAWLEIEREHNKRTAEHYPAYADPHWQLEIDQKRLEFAALFPNRAVLEGLYDEHDYAAHWCWRNVSPANGNCCDWQSAYPACPLVLSTAYVKRWTYRDKDWEKVSYKDPGKHVHEGTWSSLWLGKTDYDYGFHEYGFANQGDRDRFLAAVPNFNWEVLPTTFAVPVLK